MNQDLTKACLDAHIKQFQFPPPIDSSIYQLTVDGYFTVHTSLVCFLHGLFLWPVWHPRVHGCSFNGSGASLQVANWQKTSVALALGFIYDKLPLTSDSGCIFVAYTVVAMIYMIYT